MQASSLIILPGKGEVVLYVDSYFRGKSFTFRTDITNLTALGQNDNVPIYLSRVAIRGAHLVPSRSSRP